jgi:hypothetical protein
MQVLNLTRLPRASKISYFSDRLLANARPFLSEHEFAKEAEAIGRFHVKL